MAQVAIPVFMFARQRSGTGALLSALNSHPSVQSLGEVFGDAHEGSGTHYFGWLKQAVVSDPELILPCQARRRLNAYLDFLRDGAVKKRLILDIKLSQCHHFEAYDRSFDGVPDLIGHVKSMCRPVIFVRRRNLLRAYLSSLSADRTGVWHTTEEGDLPKLKVEPRKALNAVQWRLSREREMDRYQAVFERATVLDYETLFDGDRLHADAVKKLEATLGISGLKDCRTDQKRLRPGTVSDIVSNFEALADTFRGTKFAWMLEA